MPKFFLTERRNTPRYPSDGLLVSVRRKGRLGHLAGLAHDFNRHGLALIIDQPLPKEATSYVSLISGDMKVDDVISVVHNCIALPTGYRCGIQFRICSELQRDQGLTEKKLGMFEARFKGMLEVS